MSDKPDTVPGLGFKDKDKALESLKILEGRDPDYQKLAVKGLLGRAKRVLTLTKDETKLQNIKDAMKTFEDFVKQFEKLNKGRENRPYLPLATVQILLPLRKEYKIEDEECEAFLEAYKAAKGEYKNLRTVSSGEGKPTWDIVRNAALKKLMDVVDEKDPEMWVDDVPSKEHMELILWAYSPEAPKIKKSLAIFEEKFGSDKTEEKKEKTEKDSKKSSKRKSESSSSNSDLSDEESPKKKSKK